MGRRGVRGGEEGGVRGGGQGRVMEAVSVRLLLLYLVCWV